MHAADEVSLRTRPCPFLPFAWLSILGGLLIAGSGVAQADHFAVPDQCAFSACHGPSQGSLHGGGGSR